MPQLKTIEALKTQLNSELNKLINLELHVTCFYHYLEYHFARSKIEVFEKYFHSRNKVELDRVILLIEVLQGQGGRLVKDRHSVLREKTFASCVNTVRAVFQLETAIYHLVRHLQLLATELKDQSFVQFLTNQYFTDRLQSVQTLTDYYQVLQPNIGARLKWPFNELISRGDLLDHCKTKHNCPSSELIYDEDGRWIQP